jgi:histidinol-phosphate/aromatic aminotransferase/cobyric acid decarboxylase-like protein
MPAPFCHCQCKSCRAPGAGHCRSHPSCGAPPARPAAPAPAPLDEHAVAAALGRLKAGSGSHSPSVAEVERALPGVVQVDACFLSNPYATEQAMSRLRAIGPRLLERMVSHYPSQSGAIASMLAPAAGVPAEQLVLGNGACELIRALLARRTGPLLLSLPTFSAYYEFASGPIVPHRLDRAQEFRLDLAELERMVDRHEPDTVVIINPNNPDGGLVPEASLVDFLGRVRGRVRQVIVDESFSHFTTDEAPPTLAPLVAELPHLVVVNSLSKSHGIAGLRLGYAVMSPLRATQIRATALWNLNAFAEWFCVQLSDPEYQRAYEGARRLYVRETRRLFTALSELPGVRVFPSAANFALLELDRSASEVATTLLARHGVYVRDCGDKWGLDGDRFLRVAARSAAENRRIVAALLDVMATPAHAPVAVAA